MANSPTPAPGLLDGIRVVDLTAIVFGPYATQVMADMGADVIKIEPPEGDAYRYASPGPERGLSGVFVNVNRGKRSVVLDLRGDEGKAALRKLIATADVFIHSMRGAAIARLGFDYEAVRAIRPDIVYVNCYGYSRRGPKRDLPAYDDTIQADCGIAALQQQITGEPGFVATIMADKVSAQTALWSTFAALFHRERTGEGQEVEVGMFETMAGFVLAEHANGRLFSPPLGPAAYHRVVSPNRKPYRTSDGWIAALIYNDRHWAKFVEAVEPEWADEGLATLEQRAARVHEVYGNLAQTFATRTTAEWIELLQGLGIPVAPINTPDDLFEDEHLNAIGFFETVASDYGDITFPGMPSWFSAGQGRVAGPCPRLGEHTDEVLAELED